MLGLLRSIKEKFDLTKEEPKNVALGAALGVFLGFVPLKCGLTGLVLFLALFTSASDTVAALVGLAMGTCSLLFSGPTAWELGKSICESDFAKSHASLWGLPVIALFGLERYHVMGGAVLGLLGAIPAYIVGYRIQTLVLKGREKVVAAVAALRKKKAEEAAAAGQTTPVAVQVEEKVGWLKRIWHFPAKKWALLVIVVLAFDLFGVKPVVRWALQNKFPDALAVALGVVGPDGTPLKRGAVTWDDATFKVSLLQGTLVMNNLEIASPKDTTQNLFKAKAVEIDVSTLALLRRRFVVNLVKLDTPELAVARDKDGSLSIEPTPAADAPKVAPGADWASRARSAFERAKKEEDDRKKKAEEKKAEEAKAKAEGKKTAAEDAAHKRPQTLAEAGERAAEGIPGANPLLASPPRWVVRKTEMTGFKVSLTDPQAAQPGFVFKTGQALEATQDRRANEKSTDGNFDGTLLSAAGKDAGSVQLTFSADPPDQDETKPTGWKVHLVLGNVDLHESDALFADGVPLKFDQGKVTITVDATGHGVDGDLDASPKISFTDVVAHARNPGQPILGADPERVAQAVTTKKNFELTDVKVTGTILSPKFDMGDSFKKILLDAGLDIAKAKAEEAAKPLIDKIEKKVPVPAGVGDGAKKGVDDVLKKGTDFFGK
jgi:uncharacterized protein (TIGR03546 family)